MPTIPYRNAIGDRIPGTTTVIGTNLGWSKEGLKYWAWKLGTEGKNYRDASNWAASVGTFAHGMVEAHIRRLPYVQPPEATPDMLVRAEAAFKTYLDWERMTRFVFVATEVNLVSEQYQYGATPDAVALVNDELHLLDWKATNGTYPDHIIQLAAYGGAWEEVTKMPLVGFHLCRFSKDYGNFSYKYFPKDRMRSAWRSFLRLRELHDTKYELEKMAA